MPGLIARQLQRACHGNLAAKLSAVRVQSLRPGPPAFKHRSEGIQLFVQRSHLGAFLFGWHWDIGDVYVHSSDALALRCLPRL